MRNYRGIFCFINFFNSFHIFFRFSGNQRNNLRYQHEDFIYIHTLNIGKSTSKSTDEERTWFEHFWGKERSKKWFIECNNKRREYQKEKQNHILKETQDKINSEKSEIINKF